MKSPFQLNSRAIKELEEDQQQMIRGVIELSDTTVKEVMVPRTDTVFLSASASSQEILACICESEHSRFPVYIDTVDNVIGILHVKDVLKALVNNDEPRPEGTGYRRSPEELHSGFNTPMERPKGRGIKPLGTNKIIKIDFRALPIWCVAK